MAVPLIEKRSHSTVHQLRTIRDGRDGQHIFCEGPKLVAELLASNFQVTALFCTPSTKSVAQKLSAKYRHSSVPLTMLSDAVMLFCSDLETPPGLIALAQRPSAPSEFMPNASTLDLVLHDVQLPQNVGAILRVAEAAGVARVASTEGSADFYGPKTLRSSAGSVFRLKLFRHKTLSDALSVARTAKRPILAATQNGDFFYDAWDWSRPATLVLGSEGRGFSEADLAQVTHRITIPMEGQVESLNVGTAAAVCLFEAARQRRVAKGN